MKLAPPLASVGFWQTYDLQETTTPMCGKDIMRQMIGRFTTVKTIRCRMQGMTRCALFCVVVISLFEWSEAWNVAKAAEAPAAVQFRKEIQPILQQYCYDCHGDGVDKGKISLDEFKSDEAMLADR